MVFDIKDIQKQLSAVPLVSPYPHDLSVAIICDVFRVAGLRPPSRADWAGLEHASKAAGLWKEQVGMLAHVLTSSTLGEDSSQALRKDADPRVLLALFFTRVEPLTAEMVRSNAFRQEEFLRKWVHAVQGQVKGETAMESDARLKKLDYRAALKEMERAEEARRREADKRLKELQEAEKRAADARGWRE
ncbi:hypothetical protein NVS55_01570 [Myxococcus stipitatus]|uniref:hypothetical protein n=1 Tax=Myxococcus stipitatus TaxID=83455 RepID=UPI003145010A